MNPGTWQGICFWVCTVGAFWVGQRWGRSRERYERGLRLIREQARRQMAEKLDEQR